jgi:hypothetical protein
MSDCAGNKKRNAQKRFLILVGMLVLLFNQASAFQESRILMGVYTGSSFDLGNKFTWSESGHVSAYNTLNFHFGVYVQSNFSKQFGIQLNFNYQNGNKHWIWSDWGSAQRGGSEATGFISVNLNGVFNYLNLLNAHLYILSGFGFNSAFWPYSAGICFNSVGGTGVKIYSKNYPRSVLNFGGTFNHLMGSTGYKSVHINFLRLNIGFEFYLSDRKAESSK